MVAFLVQRLLEELKRSNPQNGIGIYFRFDNYIITDDNMQLAVAK